MENIRLQVQELEEKISERSLMGKRISKRDLEKLAVLQIQLNVMQRAHDKKVQFETKLSRYREICTNLSQAERVNNCYSNTWLCQDNGGVRLRREREQLILWLKAAGVKFA